MASDDLVERLLRGLATCPAAVLERPGEFKVQVLYSEVVNNQLVRHPYRVDDSLYFYPASAIKTCGAIAAAQKLARLRRETGKSLTLDTRMLLFPVATRAGAPTAEERGRAAETTLAREVHKMSIVSDNEAYNRLYGFVGHQQINEAMWAAGLASTRLLHRLSESRPAEEHLWSQAAELYPPEGGPVSVPAYRTALRGAPGGGPLTNEALQETRVGRAVVERGALRDGPFDFTAKNRMTVGDMQDMLVKLARPDIQLSTPGFDLPEAERLALLEAMRLYPSQWPPGGWAYPDDYCKLLLPGLCRVLPKARWRVYSKIGRAYGYTIENAYVTDAEGTRAFFVTAVIYTNANGVLNDDKYEYREVADPFMAAVGEACARHSFDVPPARAAWVTRFDYKTRADVERIVEECAAAGLNTLFFQVRGNGTAYYQSALEPWAQELLPEDQPDGRPDWDPLRTAIDAARGRGLALHAWVNVAPAWRGREEPRSRRQLWHARPAWMWYDQRGARQPLTDFYVSLNLCLPEVREYVVAVLRDLLEGYPDLDGLHLDYIRFPNEPPAIPAGSDIDYPRDERTLELFGAAPEADRAAWDAWRAEQVTALVVAIRALVDERNAGRAAYPPAALAPARSGRGGGWRSRRPQDAQEWLRRGLLDAVLPMAYRKTGADLAALLEGWGAGEAGCPVRAAAGRTSDLCLFAYSSLAEQRARGPALDEALAALAAAQRPAFEAP
eukprot:tig00000849_g4756.t1